VGSNRAVGVPEGLREHPRLPEAPVHATNGADD